MIFLFHKNLFNALISDPLRITVVQVAREKQVVVGDVTIDAAVLLERSKMSGW